MNRDVTRVEDILRAANVIAGYVRGVSKPAFDRSQDTRDKIAMQVVVLGEACSHLSPEFQVYHSEIRWGDFIGMRGVIAHQYMAIDYDLVWDAVKRTIPELARYLRKIDMHKKTPRQIDKDIAEVLARKKRKR